MKGVSIILLNFGQENKNLPEKLFPWIPCKHDVLSERSACHNGAEVFSSECFWQVTDRIGAACRAITRHGSAESPVIADYLTQMDSPPTANVKSELLSGIGGRWVSGGSRAVLHAGLASRSPDVKLNELQLRFRGLFVSILPVLVTPTSPLLGYWKKISLCTFFPALFSPKLHLFHFARQEVQWRLKGILLKAKRRRVRPYDTFCLPPLSKRRFFCCNQTGKLHSPCPRAVDVICRLPKRLHSLPYLLNWPHNNSRLSANLSH